MYEESIIVIDDNETFNKALCEKLNASGFKNVFPFLHAGKALDSLSLINPNVILSEVSLHEIDGWQFCKIIKSKEYEKHNNVPVILYSSSGEDIEAYHLASDAGASAIIQTPFTHEDLITLVYTHIITKSPNSHKKKEPLTKRVVIADDDQNILNILKFCLEESGFDVATAEDGRRAISVIEETKPHVVLLDYQMPVMDGLDVLKWIKNRFPETSVIVLTAHGSENTAITFMKEGADDYLRKPFDIKKLPSVCDIAFKKYNLRQNSTRFKQKVMELKESEEKYRGIVDNSSDLIYTIDRNGLFSFVNKQGKELLQYTPEEMIGKPFSDFIYKEDVQKVGRQFFERRTGKRASKRFEVSLISKNGALITLEVNAQGLYSEPFGGKKRFLGTLGICRDITNQKKMQERLLQADKLSSIGTLVSGVAHELNNPLTSIAGFTEELLRDSLLSKSNRKDTEMIYTEAQRCIKIVQSLLTFARKHNTEKRFLSIAKVIQGTINLVDFQLRSNNIELNLHLDKDDPLIYGDFYQLQQVFLNIINNSIDAMADKREQGSLTIASNKSDSKIEITFTNNGPLINEAIVSKIFDPFFTTKDIGKGTGLGLSIAHGIISDHNGAISVENLKNGVCFTINLPLISENSLNESQKIDIDEEPVIRGKKILLAEDNEGIQELMRRMLKRGNHELLIAVDGNEALELAKKNDFDLVISDLKMPSMDGITFYKNLVNYKPELAKRFIIMTGMISKDVLEFADKRGILYIQKPFRQKDFNRLMSRLFKEDK